MLKLLSLSSSLRLDSGAFSLKKNSSFMELFFIGLLDLGQGACFCVSVQESQIGQPLTAPTSVLHVRWLQDRELPASDSDIKAQSRP